MILVKRRRLGLVLRAGPYGYQCDIMAGAHDECLAQGVDLVCFGGGTLAEADPHNSVFALAEHVTLDGLIVATSTLGVLEDGPQASELLSRMPRVPTCIIGSPQPGLSSVSVDNLTGVRELTRHLIRDHGRRRIAFIEGTNHESEQRFAGYRQALAECGVPYAAELVVPGYFMATGGAEAVSKLFSQPDAKCDAIVAANDWMATGALEALAIRGIKVPDAVSVVGFDDIEQSRFLTPPLSTIRQDPRNLGMEAVRVVNDLLDGKLGERERWLPTSVQIRRSCGCFVAVSPDLHAERLPAECDLNGLLGEHSRAWIRALNAATPAGKDFTERSSEQLVEALVDDLKITTGRFFVTTLERLLNESDHLGNVAAWHDVVTTLRGASAPILAGLLDPWLRAEGIFQQAHILIGDYANRLQGKRALQRDMMMRALDVLGAELRTALDLPSLRSTLAEHLPRVGLPSCHVVGCEEQVTSASEGLLICAYEADRKADTRADPEQRFPAGSLLPQELIPTRRHSLVIKPLFSGDKPLGFCLMEIGTFDGQLYETLPELISNTLRASQLSRALVDEATRRQRAEQQRMAQELEIAARIQTAILPARCDVEGLEIASYMLPASEVGGDYFDILPTADGCWLGIGDVAGHGLNSGLVMLMIQSAVAAIIRSNPDSKPSRAWLAVNSVLCDNIRERLRQDEHVTLTLIHYSVDGQLCFSGAHEDLIIYRASQGHCELVNTPGIWAGIFEGVPEDQALEDQVQLEPGDLLVLYTDGVLEATNEAGEHFGVERLCASLEQAAALPVEAIRQHIVAAVQAWMFNQVDDLTLLVLRYSPRLR
jgi:serine phosphatase RsbU (regulator of sigma subunit)/DNA-binding LacI/PurR family transcriptional regulator